MIIIRKENFGGIAFNTKNAHEIWINKKLYDEIVNHIHAPRKINEKIANLLKELDIKKINPKDTKLISLPNLNNSFDFPILNSPSIIDVNITRNCNLNCPHCYMNSKTNNDHMSLDNYKIALREIEKAGVFQIALGGGEPTTHPDFIKILKLTKKTRVIPNLTTNGKDLSLKNIIAISTYCSAVAFSVEGINSDFEKIRNFPFSSLIETVKKFKLLKTNIVFQIAVSKNNIQKIDKITNYLLRFKPYGILFLAYKPVGRGEYFDKPLSKVDQNIVNKAIIKIKNNLKHKTKIGFDCCFAPALQKTINSKSLTGCTASRTSMAIMPDMTVMPCSFLDKNREYPNLKDNSLIDIWQNKFNYFRVKIKSRKEQNKCINCPHLDICLGGCPELDLVNC
ncbi:radical SAM protein [Candidatus Parcubacteria bacterium]|nr:radical SAM protein [Candidatus Parcubacteria bacterium]